MKEGKWIDVLDYAFDLMKQELGSPKARTMIKLYSSESFINDEFSHDEMERIKNNLEGVGFDFSNDESRWNNRQLEMKREGLTVYFEYKPDHRYELNKLEEQKKKLEERISEVQDVITKEKESYMEEDVSLDGDASGY